MAAVTAVDPESDSRLAQGLLFVARARADIATAQDVMTKTQDALAVGDKALADVESGLQLAGETVTRVRRVAPKVALVVGVLGVVAVAVVVVRKRSARKADQV